MADPFSSGGGASAGGSGSIFARSLLAHRDEGVNERKAPVFVPKPVEKPAKVVEQPAPSAAEDHKGVDAAAAADEECTVIRIKRRRDEAPVEALVVRGVVGKKVAKRRIMDQLAAQLGGLSTEASTAPAAATAGSAAAPAPPPPAKVVFRRVEAKDGDNTIAAVLRKARANAEANTLLLQQAHAATHSIPDGTASRRAARQEAQAAARAAARGSRPGFKMVDVSVSNSAASAVRVFRQRAAIHGTDLDELMAASPVTVNGTPFVSVPQPPTPAKPVPAKAQRIMTPGERQMDEAVFIACRSGEFDRAFRLIASRMGDVNYQRFLADGTTLLMAAARHGKVDVVHKLLNLGAQVSVRNFAGETAVDCARDEMAAVSSAAAAGPVPMDTDDGYVYDYYLSGPAEASTSSTADGDKDWAIVELPEDDNDVGADDSADDHDSEDSNAEDYFANDYPDEESTGYGRRMRGAHDEDDGFDDDDDDGHGDSFGHPSDVDSNYDSEAEDDDDDEE